MAQLTESWFRLTRQALWETQKSDGKWVLITNDDTISLEDAARGYKGLLVCNKFNTIILSYIFNLCKGGFAYFYNQPSS